MVMAQLQRHAAVRPNGVSASAGAAAPPIVHRVLGSPGQPLDPASRAQAEHRFGHDFSRVRVHVDTEAAVSAGTVGAEAYTVGNHIVFAAGRHRPQAPAGRDLLRHELVHVVQQRSAAERPPDRLPVSAPDERPERDAAAHRTGATVGPCVQRELAAYDRPHVEYLPTMGTVSQTWIEETADAPGLTGALAPLIAAGKIGTRTVGDVTYFFPTGATSAEVDSALRTAGYATSADLARSLMAAHQAFLFSHGRVTRMSWLFGSMELARSTDTLTQRDSRPLTQVERTEATKVFGSALDYDRITVTEGAALGVGSARTLPTTINFPRGSSGGGTFMPWLIHELTHSWQYRRGVGVSTTLYHALLGSYDYGGDAELLKRTSEGRGITSFNTEQQGDILQNYYERLGTPSVGPLAPFLPYVREVQGLPAAPPPPAPAPAPPTP